MPISIERGTSVLHEYLSNTELIPLPPAAQRFLSDLRAPPRLIAHLTLVHDTANLLLSAFGQRFPEVSVDTEVVLLGSALHDIGKTRVDHELVKPGNEHESVGEELLLELGIDARVAALARTHGDVLSNLPEIDDYLVVLADKLWKAKRNERVEAAFVSAVAAATNEESWAVFDWFDDVASRITANADERLSWQAQHPVSNE
ncbi:MAG: HD domain-containing protein [Myxococcota bacterium]